MPSIISTGGQTSHKNSYASSAQVRLSLRANGEEECVVITADGTVVKAGFVAPTAAPVVTDSGSGNVPAGEYRYVYAYASSQYPFAENDIAYNGAEWPRSNPSPSTAVTVSGASQVSVQVPTSPLSNVDNILIFRTVTMTTAAEALAEAEAGRLFYVGSILNALTPTVTYVDNSATNTGEQVEVDNFPCPCFRFTVFDGFYWWGWGNTTFTGEVTLDDSSTITLNDGVWFSGRNGFTATLNGVTSGGYDQRGSYYFKWVSTTTAQLCVDPELASVSTISASGITQIQIRGPETTLYRSKARNPFSWGRTTQLNDPVDPNATIYVSDVWAEKIGGGYGTGLALIPNEGYLKLDTEAPQKSYALDLTAADSDAFLSTLRTLDEAQSTSSHFSQFPMRVGKQVVIGSVNAKANQLLSADAQTQVPIGDNAIRTLRRVSAENSDFFHGVFDYRTELNCWFLKTTHSAEVVDTLIYQHAPTGFWGTHYCPGVTASATVFDYVTRKHFTFVGDTQGRISIAFAEGVYTDFSNPSLGNQIMQFVDEGFTFKGWLIPVLQIESSDTATITSYGTPTEPSNAAVVTVFDSAQYTVGQRVWFSALHTYPITGNGTVTEIVNANVINVVMDDELPGGSLDTNVSPEFMSHPMVIRSADGQDIFLISEYSAWLPYPGATPAPPGYGWAAFFGEVAGDPTLYGLSGVNLSNGEFGPVTNATPQNWYFGFGATACFLRRYFNSGTPEGCKRTLELWMTLKNTDTLTLTSRFIQEYDEYGAPVPVVPVALNRDVRGSSSVGSMRYFSKSPPSDLLPAIGVDFFEAGYLGLQIYDFTIPQAPA